MSARLASPASYAALRQFFPTETGRDALQDLRDIETSLSDEQIAKVRARIRADANMGDAAETTDGPAPDLSDELLHACIAGIAIATLAPRKARSLALIGDGEQAKLHMGVAMRTRQFEIVRVYGRRPVAATDLAKTCTRAFGVASEVSGTPEEAVHNADVVVLATETAEPLIDPDWVAKGAHINFSGPLTRMRHELLLGLVRRAKHIISENPQLLLSHPSHALSSNSAQRRLQHLGEMIDQFNPDRNRGLTLFLPAS